MFLEKDMSTQIVFQSLSTKTLKILKMLSNNFIQIFLLGFCMSVHVVTRHGSGKVFLCLIPICQLKVNDSIVQTLYLSIIKNGYVIPA